MSLALQTPLVNVGTTGAPPFLNSWTNYQNSLQWCSYWKDANGMVHLRGVVRGGVGGYGAGGYNSPNAIFRLPIGFRPGGIERFSCAAWPGELKGAHITIPSLDVEPGGLRSTPQQLIDPPLGSTWVDVLSYTYGGYVVPWQDGWPNGWIVSLSGISFFADH